MSDLEFLYAVMAAFYLWECTHWLPLQSVSFISWWGGSFRITQPFFVANSREAGLVFASPVPCLGTFVAASEWRCAISPAGIADESGNLFQFTKHLQLKSRRQQILVNDQCLATRLSRSQARWLVNKYRHMAAASELDREEMITKWIQESLDSSALEGRLQEFRQVSRFSSAATGLLFLFVFVVSPILIWRLGFALLWPWLLGGLVVLCVLNAIAFYRAHKRLHPELDDERFAHFLMALLFPPAGMRVRDTLSRPLVERFHALAVAKATCAPDEFAKIAGRVVRELKFPRRPLSTQPTNAEPARRWFNQAMLAEVIRFLSKNNLTMDSLLCPPERTDPEGRSYCPRCQAQFTMDSGVCSDCGVVLVEFSRF